MRFQIGESAGRIPEDLLALLVGYGGEVVVEFSSYGFASGQEMYDDVARGWLEASYVGESLAACCDTIAWRECGSGSRHGVQFALRAYDAAALAHVLANLDAQFAGNADPLYSGCIEDLLEFEGEIDRRKWRLPDLGDRYYACAVAGRWGLDDDALEARYQAHPEQRFGFWRSCASDKFGHPFYVSERAWIVPTQVDLERLLREYGDFEEGDPSFQAATRVVIDDAMSIVYNRAVAVHYPFDAVDEARRCAQTLWPTGTEHEEAYPDPAQESPGVTIAAVRLSSAGELLVLEHGTVRYVFLRAPSPPITREQAERCRKILTTVADALDALVSPD